MTHDDLVLREDHGRVALLTLNRPDRLNAWSRPMEDRYFDLLTKIDADPEIRAIVVTGAGRAFCAGADVDDLAAAADGSRPPEGSRRPRYLPLTIGTPIIAAINGPAVAVGLVQALFCDVRFAAEGAKLITMFSRRGLVAEFGSSWILTHTVGRGRALDLLLSGRAVLGPEAKAIGLVEKVVPDQDLRAAALAYAADLAELASPFSTAMIKSQVAADLERNFLDSYEDSRELMDRSLRRTDAREGVASFAERRPPRFGPWPES